MSFTIPFRSSLSPRIRPPQFAGISYPDTEAECRAMCRSAIEQYIHHHEEQHRIAHDLCALLVPHIDFRVNLDCYSAVYHHLRTIPKPDIILLLATSHHGWQDVIIPTYQHFQTPLGVMKTDQESVEKLYAYCGFSLTQDDSAHAPEHSIEFEVLWLQYMLGNDIPIIPLLCTGFDSFDAELPTASGRRGHCVKALQQVLVELQAEGKRVLTVVSGDLSHVGKRFGDTQTAHAMANVVWRYEEDLLTALANCSESAYYDILRRNDDAYRICGAVPTLIMLQILSPQRATQVYHAKWDDVDTDSSVGFATMLFFS